MSQRKQIKQAASLYRRFSGHKAESAQKVKVRKLPKTAVAIGTIVGVIYDTIRDGKRERYIHEFRKRSRPLFAVSHDGKQLLMLGGAYDFTERGIVDRR